MRSPLLPGLALLSFAFAGALADEPALQSPIVTAGADFHSLRPEMYRHGWIDLNKNGNMDPYEDPSQPVDVRVTDLLKRMTLDEKIGQLEQQHMENDSDRSAASLLASGGLGSFLGAGRGPGLRNRLQRISVEDSRLGIPLIFGFDTIHGFRTVFPIPLGLSCSWDPGLVERIERVAAAESAAVGIDWVFAPMVDIARDPRWGRIAEGAGEDPWLGSQFAAAEVRGFQGPDYGQTDRVAACLKHYVGYGAAEGGRDYNTTEIGLPTLRNIYLPPFRAGVAAGAATVMSAFNCLNGVPASGNRFTLTEVLRDQWGFRGFVVSDWNAVAELIDHGYAADRATAARMALSAGVDMEMVSDCYRTDLPALLEQGKITSDELDRAVRRILRVKVVKGLFDRPYAAALAAEPPPATALARETVARCCVLLKNENDTLPLRQKSGTLALIGPLGDSRAELLGCWAGMGRTEDVVTLKEGLAAGLPGMKVVVAKGCSIAGDDSDGMDEAVAAARGADVIVLAVGEAALMSGENNFRSTLGLPGRQQELFDRVAALGKPVVTVVFAGRPLGLPVVLQKSAAVLWAWHPGIEGGPGIADVLTGVVAPSGRLTTTFPRSVGQVPVYYNHLHTGRPFADYKDGTREPLLPFGYGLTYTRFAYGPTRLSADRVTNGSITATVTLSNAGSRAGTEVVQLYLRAFASSVGARPMRELKGFQRVTLQPGERKEVSFTLATRELGCWSPEGKWVVEPGNYAVVAAADSSAGTMVPFKLE